MLGERTYSMCALFPRLTLAGERIQETHSGRCNIVDIACDQGPVMYQCSCRHQAVNHRQRVRDIETPPCLGHTGGDRDNAVTVGMTEMGIASRRESAGDPRRHPAAARAYQLPTANGFWRSRFSRISRRVCGLASWLRVGDVRH